MYRKQQQERPLSVAELFFFFFFFFSSEIVLVPKTATREATECSRAFFFFFFLVQRLYLYRKQQQERPLSVAELFSFFFLVQRLYLYRKQQQEMSLSVAELFFFFFFFYSSEIVLVPKTATREAIECNRYFPAAVRNGLMIHHSASPSAQYSQVPPPPLPSRPQGLSSPFGIRRVKADQQDQPTYSNTPSAMRGEPIKFPLRL